MSKVEHNGIYYDPNNEIVCDKRTINNLIVENEHYKKQVADLEAKLAESEEFTQGYRKECAKIQTDYYELKQQLAEKDEQLKELTECNQYLQIYRNQDKISFAVEKLEKVKEEFDCCYSGDTYSPYQIADKIDEIIAELPHQHEDKGE